MTTRTIEKAAFGRTGHRSSRVIFGAAALYSMRQDRADQLLETLLEHGINHIDTAADYGDSEPLILEAAASPAAAPTSEEIDGDIARYEMKPLFHAELDDI